MKPSGSQAVVMTLAKAYLLLIPARRPAAISALHREIKNPAKRRPYFRFRPGRVAVSNHLAPRVPAHLWQFHRSIRRGSRNFHGRTWAWEAHCLGKRAESTRRPLAYYEGIVLAEAASRLGAFPTRLARVRPSKRFAREGVNASLEADPGPLLQADIIAASAAQALHARSCPTFASEGIVLAEAASRRGAFQTARLSYRRFVNRRSLWLPNARSQPASKIRAETPRYPLSFFHCFLGLSRLCPRVQDLCDCTSECHA